jgi:hypothetical protein
MDESEVMDLHYNYRDANQSVISNSVYDNRSMAGRSIKSIGGLGFNRQKQLEEERRKQKEEYNEILA